MWNQLPKESQPEPTIIHSRKLKPRNIGIDFYSNDYLGLVKDKVFLSRIHDTLMQHPKSLLGNTGSRLISGNSDILTSVEGYLAQLHSVESALLFPSGYTANLALISTLIKKGDTLIVDEFVHRSIMDGYLMSTGTRWKFKHNDMQHLESLLKKSSGRIFIAVESLYSMNGDKAPLAAVIALAKRYKAEVILDEAHALGVFGLGLANQQKIQHEFLAITVTYGKAMGLYGAAILCSHAFKNYLVQNASPFIYSTAIPDFHALAVKESYDYLLESSELQERLQNNIVYFRSSGLPLTAESDSPIQIFKVAEGNSLNGLVDQLLAAGLLTYAIWPPTVPLGQECLRISIHADHRMADMDLLIEILKKYA